MRKGWHNLMSALGVAISLGGCATAPAPSALEQTDSGAAFESDEFIVVLAKAGDTPQSLAAKFLGDAGKDWMIMDYNGSPTLSAGQQVVIPKRFWRLSGVSAAGFQLIPILVYHNVAPQAKGRMTIAVKTFEEQMRYLKAQGLRVISLKEFLEFTSLKRQVPQKSLVITFDDGFKSFVQHAYPILKQLGFSATLFVYTDYIGTGGNALSWPELRKLAEEGFDIQGHSKSHGDLRRAGGEAAAEYAKRLGAELTQSRELFVKNLGYAPTILAYPFGAQDDAVLQKTKESGYLAAFTVRRQGNPAFVETLRIHRSQVYSEMSMDDFVKNLNFFNREALQ